MDGTINPADLASSGAVLPATDGDRDATPRGVKRARSSDVNETAGDAAELDDDDDLKPRKRGRPAKPTKGGAVDGVNAGNSETVAQTPEVKPSAAPEESPASPSKATPSGKNTKALPTMRDHTYDKLDDLGDEYIPRDTDDAGEKKVTETGYLRDGRKYKCRTFILKNRGPKLFMLATECARVLNYRDSYLLFNKNRSLHKIIASQIEKEDLIAQEILPFSYRSRQIAIVTARSMYRQFGAKMIEGGRRVRDDYWEAKARKQGFTEDDLPGEKRPGVKPRESTANHMGPTNLQAQQLLNGTTISYDYSAAIPGMQIPATAYGMSNLPMLMPDYGNVPRSRQDVTGSQYQDRSQPSARTDIINQAAQTAEFNKAIKGERVRREKSLQEQWNKPHEQTQTDIAPRPVASPAQSNQQIPQMPQNFQAGQNSARAQQAMQPQNYQQMLAQQQAQGQMMNNYSANMGQFNPQTSMQQSPMQQRMQPPMRPDQNQQQRNPNNFAYSNTGAMPPPGMYNAYGQPQPQPQQQQQQQMWAGQQGQPNAQMQAQMQQFAQSQPSPQHMQQSPQHQGTQNMHHQQNNGQMNANAISFQGMAGMNPANFAGMNRGMYQQNQNPQHFMQASPIQQQPGMQGWSPQNAQHAQQQQWQFN